MSEALSAPRGGRRHLVVAGGGLAGWLAAAFLQRSLRPLGWRVTIVAPPTPSRPDCAVATGPAFTRLLQQLGLERDRVLRRCGGSYRLGSLLKDWVAPGRSLLLPFGPCGPRPGGHDLFHYWLKARRAAEDVPDYGSHSLVANLAEQGLGPLKPHGASPVEEEGDYGFHLDATELRGLLRDVALAEGVRWIEDRVAGAERVGETIAALSLARGERLDGDVFIDATGPAAVLSENLPANQRPFWGGPKLVIETRRLAAASDRRPLSFYRAMAEGYAETIPLAGHAVETVVRLAGADDTASFAPGRRGPVWRGNVLALGQAAVMLPPLHGLSWLLVQRSLELYLDWLPRGAREAELRAAFNGEIDRDIAAAEEAVSLSLSAGTRGEAFWAAVRSSALAPSLRQRLDLYEAAGRVVPLSEAIFPETAHYHLLTGAGRWPRDVFAPVDALDPQQCRQLLEAVRRQNGAMMRGTLPHEEILSRLHGRKGEGHALPPRGGSGARPDRLAAIRATEGGRRLVALVASLGQPFAIERSVKAEQGRLQRERFLTSVHRAGLGPEPGRTVERLAAELGLPEPYRRTAAGAIGDADILHLGYEDGPHGPLHKLYVEWSSRADRIWHDPAADPGTEPVLVHRAYKWDPAHPGRVVTTLYHWPRVRSAADIQARLPALGQDAGGVFTSRLAETVLDLVETEGSGFAHFLEVREEDSPRVSFDLNLYATGLTVGDLAGIIEPAFSQLAVPAAEIGGFLAEHGAEPLGHLAAGVGRRGDPFVTVYFGGGEP